MNTAFWNEICRESMVFVGNSCTLYLMSPRRYSSRISKLIWLGVFAASVLVMIMFRQQYADVLLPYDYMVSLALCALIYLTTSEGNLLRNIFLFSTFINIFLWSVAFSQAISVRFFENHPLAIMEFRLIFIVVFCVVVSCDLRPLFLQISPKLSRGWGSLSVLVLVFCLCLLAASFLTDLFRSVTQEIFVMLCILFVIMVAAYIVIFQMISVMGDENRKRQLEMEKKFLSSQLSSYEQMEREARKYRHDFRHHNLLILEYAKHQDCNAIMDYLQEYERAADRKLDKRVCVNMTINSIISAFLNRAAEQDIQMTTDIRIREKLSIQDTDLVAILANLLENAEKGALAANAPRKILFSMVHRGTKLAIQCENSCSDQVQFSQGIPQAVGRTGVGITSIIDTAANYDGDCQFFVKDGMFHSQILLHDPPDFSAL